jgi:membrane-associated HD superfamily phosphohydrolase
MESGKDLNYWPGFVDALSNVVLTLVFVLVVFVFALVMASNKVEQKVIELAQQTEQRQEQKVQAEQEVLELRQELREALEHMQQAESENEKLRKQVAELKRQQVPGSEERNELKEKVEIKVEQPAAKAEDDRDTTAESESNAGVIVIVFPRGIFEINDKARAELDRNLGSQKAQLAGMTASVRSVIGVETYSEARRLAYFRGLTVRNYLIDKGLGSGRTINMVIEQAKEVGDGRVEIRFHRR